MTTKRPYEPCVLPVQSRKDGDPGGYRTRDPLIKSLAHMRGRTRSTAVLLGFLRRLREGPERSALAANADLVPRREVEQLVGILAEDTGCKRYRALGFGRRRVPWRHADSERVGACGAAEGYRAADAHQDGADGGNARAAADVRQCARQASQAGRPLPVAQCANCWTSRTPTKRRQRSSG